MFAVGVAFGLSGSLSGATLENIALGKPCTFSKKPNYALTRDLDDAKQLTDGKFVRDNAGCLWTNRESVGWEGYDHALRVKPPTVTVDLGKDEPICGFSWNLAFGISGVTFPESIDIYVSQDGQSWHHVGDLLARAVTLRIMPPPGYYNVYRAWTDDMPCHGRFVMFVPIDDPYCFVDEIEVYRGDEALLSQPMVGEATSDPVRFHGTLLIRNRLRKDAETVNAPDEVRAAISKVCAEDFPADFRTELPLNGVHRAIFAANAVRLRKAGMSRPTLWIGDRWENLSPVVVPTAKATEDVPISVEMMRGEVRAAAINLANPTDEALECACSVEGFADDTPVVCEEVVFTDMKQYRATASALRTGDGPGVRFEIPSGTSKQVWLSVRRPTGAAGVRRGRVSFRLSDGTVLSRELSVLVYDLDYPKIPSLHMGGWDYLNGVGHGKRTSLRRPTIDYLRELGVDVAWGTRDTLPAKPAFDAAGQLTNALDFAAWEKWVKDVPGMRVYAVFEELLKGFHGEPFGTVRYGRMLTSYFRAWGEHLRATGFDGVNRRVLILPFDEPNRPEQAQKILVCLRAIKAAECPEIGVFLDPQFSHPEQIPAELWDLCDVISPLYTQIESSTERIRFYADLAAQGKEVWLYEAHGPSRIYDPVSYYRRQAWAAYSLGSETTGSQFWAFGCGGGIGNSWTAYAQTRTEFSPYFVTPEGPMDAKQCEGIREGREDFELLRLYESRFGRNATEKIVAFALKELPFGDPDWDAEDRKHGLLDQLRIRMLRRLSERGDKQE